MSFNREVMFSSATEEWSTPQHIFDQLDREFHFTLDPCATPENAKCEKFYTKEDNGLHQLWNGETVFMNPPYGRVISKWVQKAYLSGNKEDTMVVCLLPARTDTKWFHKWCVKGDIWFIAGRLKFGGNKNAAPFPSMIVVFPQNWKDFIVPPKRMIDLLEDESDG